MLHGIYSTCSTDIIFLLDVLPQMGSIWSESGLDQPAQCYSGLFPKAVLCDGKIVSRICHEPGRRTEHIQLFILWTLQSVIFVVLRIAFCENVYVCYHYGNGMLDGFGAFSVYVAESKRIWQSCQLRCGCHFFADGAYDLSVLQPDYVC